MQKFIPSKEQCDTIHECARRVFSLRDGQEAMGVKLSMCLRGSAQANYAALPDDAPFWGTDGFDLDLFKKGHYFLTDEGRGLFEFHVSSLDSDDRPVAMITEPYIRAHYEEGKLVRVTEGEAYGYGLIWTEERGFLWKL